MEQETTSALAELAMGRISIDQFVARVGMDPRQDGRFVLLGLEQAISERAAPDVECLMIVVGQFGAWPEWATLLGNLLLADWHTRHEDIADTLQNLRDPSTVEALFQCTQAHFSYRDYDDSESLTVKCLWALHDIGTTEAVARLQTLASSERPIVRERAARLLGRLAERRAGDPIESYRRHRDAKVHR